VSILNDAVAAARKLNNAFVIGSRFYSSFIAVSSGHRAIDPAEAFRLVTPDFELCILPESPLNDRQMNRSTAPQRGEDSATRRVLNADVRPVIAPQIANRRREESPRILLS